MMYTPRTGPSRTLHLGAVTVLGVAVAANELTAGKPDVALAKFVSLRVRTTSKGTPATASYYLLLNRVFV